jgi:hypothetical protein
MRKIGTVYWDLSTRGVKAKHRKVRRLRAEVIVNGVKYRRYVKSVAEGENFCNVTYQKFN